MSKLDQYYRFSKVAGVNIHIQSNGQPLIQVCQVEANGNQLDITKKFTDLTSINQLKEHLPAKAVISLNLSGKGILHKRIDKVETIDQNAFSKVLPNVKLEDFYMQNFISGEYSFVSIARKTEAGKWLNQLNELNFQPLLLSLGVFPIENIIPQLNIYEHQAIIGGYQIQRNDKGEWIDVKATEESSAFAIKLASEKMDEKLLIPYATAFQLVMINQLDTVRANDEKLDKILNAKQSEQKLKVQGVIALAVIFTLLLLNYVTLSWFNSSNAVLSEQVGKYAETTSNEQEVSDKIKQKQTLLHALGWDGGINKSILIDQVASLMPPEITLQAISVNPVDVADSRVQKMVVYDDKKIIITGNSEKIIPVNEWIARIKTKSWVKNIQLENFAFDNELNTGRFIIAINY
ncbi:MAG: hypothetical protein JST50_06940 [Bacteroidetes bacterium]|nr:hypothetical protein [Bacteroidota bacterium]